MWASDKTAQSFLVPTIVSSAFREGVDDTGSPFLNAFQYTGTRDYAPFCTIQRALEFRQDLGGEDAVQSYVNGLARWGLRHLVRRWGTEQLLPDAETHQMVNPRVPAAYEAGESACPVSELGAQLRAQYGIEAVVYKLTDPLGGAESWWFRLSAQIYLERSDFVKLGDAVLALAAGTTAGL